MAETLTDHEDIRSWVSRRAGNPALMQVPDGTGQTRPVLRIVFGQRALDNDDITDGPDRVQGMGEIAEVTWDDWFAVLDEQNLALRVSSSADGSESGFEFVPRDAA